MNRQPKTIKSIAAVLAAVMEIDAAELEKLVRQAHECEINQMDEPVEQFIVSRQSLRMLWHFRRNLESVEVTPRNG